MPIFKKIFKNFLIVLAILIGVCGLTFSAMYFIGFPLFGYKVRKATDYNRFPAIELDLLYEYGGDNAPLNFDKVVIETKHIPVFISPTGRELNDLGQGSASELSSISITDRAWGFVKADYSKEDAYSISVDPNLTTKILTITVNEPDGFLFKRNSAIWLDLDYAYFNEGKVEVRSVTSDVRIMKSFSAGRVKNEQGQPIISALTDDAELAEFTYTALGKTFPAIFEVNGQGSLNSSVDLNDVTIKTTKGSVLARNILGNSEIITKSGVVTFAHFSGTSLKIRAENSKVNFVTATGNVEYSGYNTGALRDETIVESKGGKINIEKVTGSFFVKSKNASVTIDEVVGSLNSDISGSGSLSVNKFTQGTTESLIKTKSGKVTLNEVVAQNQLRIETKSGKVNVALASAKMEDMPAYVSFKNKETSLTEAADDKIAAAEQAVQQLTEDGAEAEEITAAQQAVTEAETEKSELIQELAEELDDIVAILTAQRAGTIVKVTTQTGAITFKGAIDEDKFVGKLDVTTKSGKVNLTNVNSKVDAVATGRGSITAELKTFVKGSKLSVNTGKLNVVFDKTVPAYILFDGKKDPSVDILNVKSLNKSGVPTAICGASQAIIDDTLPLITLTNAKGKTTLKNN